MLFVVTIFSPDWSESQELLKVVIGSFNCPITGVQ